MRLLGGVMAGAAPAVFATRAVPAVALVALVAPFLTSGIGLLLAAGCRRDG